MKNIVRRIVGQGGNSPKPEDQSLYLTHLKKLFSEVRQPAPGATQKSIEDKLYNMLPLFCKVSSLSYKLRSFMAYDTMVCIGKYVRGHEALEIVCPFYHSEDVQ